jgi:hypothetical protein
LVEHEAFNLRVAGSSPAFGIFCKNIHVNLWKINSVFFCKKIEGSAIQEYTYNSQHRMKPQEMRDKVFSRAYLQSIPDENKQKLIDGIINKYIKQRLFAYASRGQTSYVFPFVHQPPLNTVPGYNAFAILQKGEVPANISIDDLITRCKYRLPECKVQRVGKWAGDTPATRYLKEGIRIDWS